MKKILFVIPSLTAGGAERSLINLLCEMPRDKYEIDLLLFKMKGAFLSQVPSNVNIIDQPYKLKKIYGPAKNGGVYGAIKIVSNVISKIVKRGMGNQKAFLWKHFYNHIIDKMEKEYDVAVGYLGGESTYYVVDKVNAVRKIHWIHSDYNMNGMPKWFDKDMFKKLDAIVTISEECLSIVKKEFPEHAYKCYFVPNITSSSTIEKLSNMYEPMEYEGKKNIFLSVGRLSKEKGFDIAVDAASILKETELDFYWFIIGDGKLKKELKNQIEKYGLEENVFLLGIKENPYPYIKNCNVFVQPSRYEGKSVAIDEAKILNKVIVATHYNTVADQITNDIDGVVVDIDSKSLANGLIELSNNEDKMKNIMNNLSKNEYGNQHEIKKCIDVIEGNILN